MYNTCASKEVLPVRSWYQHTDNGSKRMALGYGRVGVCCDLTACKMPQHHTSRLSPCAASSRPSKLRPTMTTSDAPLATSSCTTARPRPLHNVWGLARGQYHNQTWVCDNHVADLLSASVQAEEPGGTVSAAKDVLQSSNSLWLDAQGASSSLACAFMLACWRL